MGKQQESNDVRIMQMITAKWISKPLFAAAELGIVDHLKAKNLSPEEIAEKTGSKPELLKRLMRVLTALDIVEPIGKEIYSLTPLGSLLCPDKMGPAAILFNSEWSDMAWMNFTDQLRNGKPGFESAYKKTLPEWLSENPGAAKIFNAANSMKAAPIANALADSFDFGRFNTIVDIGGGTGLLISAIREKYPDKEYILAELPGIIMEAKKKFPITGTSERIKFAECDFFKSVPEGGDIYILCNILHDWDEKECGIILRNIRKVMNGNSRLLVIEMIVPDDGSFSISKLMDLEMMVMSGGKERTRKEFDQLFFNGGFQPDEIFPVFSEYSGMLLSISE